MKLKKMKTHLIPRKRNYTNSIDIFRYLNKAFVPEKMAKPHF